MGLCSLAGEARAGGKKKTVVAASLASSFLLLGVASRSCWTARRSEQRG
jgi:hypothetical protein